MANPPSSIPASELFQKLQELPRPFTTVDFPRKGKDGETVGQLAIRILTQEEILACSAAAETFTRKMLKTEQGGEIPGKHEAQQGYDDIYKNSSALELLVRACRVPEDTNQPIFPSREAMRRTLTNDEIGVLMNHYILAQEELGPIVAFMTSDEMESWIKRLVEGGNAYPLGLLSSGAQAQLVMHMASQLYKLPTDTLSSGSPADASSMSTADSEST